MIPYFLIRSFGPKIGSVDGICHQTDSISRFYLDLGVNRQKLVLRRRPYIMGSELRCQNFDLVKFREIIPRNPCYGTFFSQNFESEFSKNSDPPAEPKLESEF